MHPSVEYLGYIVDKDGLHATPSRVAAIIDAPEPQNVQQLRSFVDRSSTVDETSL